MKKSMMLIVVNIMVNFNKKHMTKKDLLIIVLKVIVYACTLFLAGLGVYAVSSCTAQRDISVSGVGRVVSVDTTYIEHRGTYQLKVK